MNKSKKDNIQKQSTLVNTLKNKIPKNVLRSAEESDGNSGIVEGDCVRSEENERRQIGTETKG